MDLTWKHSYETGSERIDNEHRVFLDLVREFVDEVGNQADHNLVLRLSHEIYKYADFHFFSEERIMTKIGYADNKHHSSVHKELLNDLRQYIVSLSLDTSQALNMAKFLIRWFISHTVNEDSKLAASIAAYMKNTNS